MPTCTYVDAALINSITAPPITRPRPAPITRPRPAPISHGMHAVGPLTSKINRLLRLKKALAYYVYVDRAMRICTARLRKLSTNCCFNSKYSAARTHVHFLGTI